MPCLFGSGYVVLGHVRPG